MSVQLNRKYSPPIFNRLGRLCIFFAMMAASFFTVAQDSIGNVLSVTGQASVERKAANAIDQVVLQQSELQEGSALFNGDTLITLEDSILRYELSDGSTYVLQANSKITIREYSYNVTQNGSQNVVHLQLVSGVMEFVSGNIGIADDGAFRIVTDFAEIGVSGSGAIITTDLNSTQVFVTQGELTGLGVDGELVLLEQGETTIFDASGEPKRYIGNITGASQTLSEDDADRLLANEDEGVDEEIDEEIDEDTESASVIFRSLLSVDPSVETPDQEQLAQALSGSINSHPSLYAELITVAIDLGLEPPTAALIVTNSFGVSGGLTEERVAEIFLASTAGIADPDAVEQAILSVDGAVPVNLSPTDTNDYGQGLNDPIPAVPINGQVASPAL